MTTEEFVDSINDLINTNALDIAKNYFTLDLYNYIGTIEVVNPEGELKSIFDANSVPQGEEGYDDIVRCDLFRELSNVPDGVYILIVSFDDDVDYYTVEVYVDPSELVDVDWWQEREHASVSVYVGDVEIFYESDEDAMSSVEEGFYTWESDVRLMEYLIEHRII